MTTIPVSVKAITSNHNGASLVCGIKGVRENHSVKTGDGCIDMITILFLLGAIASNHNVAPLVCGIEEGGDRK
jgi:hypothetical protein